jgi:aminodeoxyfutalosine synthase
VSGSIQHSELRDIYDQVAAGGRISEADALRLFESKDLNAVGAIADLSAGKKSAPRQLHRQPLHQLLELLHPVVPVLLVRAQETRRRRLGADRAADRRKGARSAQARHHGTAHRRRLHPSLPFSYYTDMLRALKAAGCAAAVEMFHRH